MGSPKAGGNKAGEPKGEAKPSKMGDDDQGDNKPDTKDPKAKERDNANKNDPIKGDGADSKPSKGGPPCGQQAFQGRAPMDGAGSASKPMGGDPKKPHGRSQVAKKPAESRNKHNKGDQKGAASKSPPSRSAGKQQGPRLAERRHAERQPEAGQLGQPALGQSSPVGARRPPGLTTLQGRSR